MRIATRCVFLLLLSLGFGCSSSNSPSPKPAVTPPTTATVTPGLETTENPEYGNWKQFKIGTVVKRRSVTERETRQTISTEVFRLIKLDDKEVVVERQNTTERSDGSYKTVNPADERRYRNAFQVPNGMKTGDFLLPSLRAKLSREEVIEVAGKSYQSKVYEWKDNTEAGEMNVTVWFSNDMPGRIVKQVMKVPALQTTTTEVVLDVVLP